MFKTFVDENNIAVSNLICSAIIVFFSGVVISFFLISSYIQTYQGDVEQYEKMLIANCKQDISRDLQKQSQNFRARTRQIEQRIKGRLSRRVSDIIINSSRIYYENKHTLPQQKLKRKITEFIGANRWNQGKNYFFVIDEHGVCSIHPLKEIAGKKLLDMKILDGRHFLQQLAELEAGDGEGFIVYRWINLPERNYGLKTSYMKKFDPLNIWIGSGGFIDDISEAVKKEFVNYFKDFELTDENEMIALFEIDDQDKTMLPILFREGSRILALKQAKATFSFINLPSSKLEKLISERELTRVDWLGDDGYAGERVPRVTCYMYYPTWNWVVVKSRVLDEFNSKTFLVKSELAAVMRKKISFTVGIVVVCSVLSLGISCLFFKAISSAFKRYKQNVEQHTAQLSKANAMLEGEIKNRNIAEENLQKSENRFLKMIQKYHDAVFILKEEAVIDCNDAAVTLLGAERKEQVVNHSFSKLVTVAEMSDERISRIINQGFVDGAGHCEVVLGKLNQTTFDASLSFVAVPFRGEQMLYLECRDISMQKQAEEKLKQASVQWEATFNSIDDMIAIVGKDFRITRSNSALDSYFKRNVEGEYCYKLFHDQDEPLAQCRCWDCQSNKMLCKLACYEGHLGGRWIDYRVFPLKIENGQVDEIIHIFSDITDQKKAEQEQEEMVKELEQFNRVMRGREDRILELKQEVNSLLLQLGNDRKYLTTEE